MFFDFFKKEPQYPNVFGVKNVENETFSFGSVVDGSVINAENAVLKGYMVDALGKINAVDSELTLKWNVGEIRMKDGGSVNIVRFETDSEFNNGGINQGTIEMENGRVRVEGKNYGNVSVRGINIAGSLKVGDVAIISPIVDDSGKLDHYRAAVDGEVELIINLKNKKLLEQRWMANHYEVVEVNPGEKIDNKFPVKVIDSSNWEKGLSIRVGDQSVFFTKDSYSVSYAGSR